eukprot:5578704-Pyramimonas_sp.AAC.1
MHSTMWEGNVTGENDRKQSRTKTPPHAGSFARYPSTGNSSRRYHRSFVVQAPHSLPDCALWDPAETPT